MPSNAWAAPCVQTAPRLETSGVRDGLGPLRESAELPTLREVFFHSVWAARLLFGCRVSGAIFRHPCRASRRYTTEGATFRPSFSANAARRGKTTSMPAVRACSTQGVRKASSSSSVIRARRRPPQRRRGKRLGSSPSRNLCCKRGTLARLTPSRAAVSSKVVWATAGKRTAWAARSSFRLVARPSPLYS